MRVAVTDLGLLFRAEGGGPVWPGVARRELREICESAGVEPITPNELRHTAATLLSETLPPHRVADILGHASVRMVGAVYRHRPEVIRGAETA